MKILFISTMYPNPLRDDTPVCHFFAKEWKDMGHEILVVHYRSMFPYIYLLAAKMLPWLAIKYIGNRIETDRNMNVVKSEKDGIQVYSYPIFKYIPHGKYSKHEINKKLNELLDLLKKNDFAPDAIVGHFYNPQLEIISRLKDYFPNASTCVSLHEMYTEVIKKNYPKDYKQLLDSIDTIGFRSVPIQRSYEANYGRHKSVLCFSGVSRTYLETPIQVKEFGDGALSKFIYVGQFIERKHAGEIVEALNKVYEEKDFSLCMVGKHEFLYEQVKNNVEKLGLTNNVKFVDFIPRDQIMQYYDEAECFIMISNYEVFGLVYLEAMARGCIAIAARNEGMDGIIKDGVNGFLCEAGNAEELASIIQRINYMSAEEKKKISEEGRKTAESLSDYNVAKTYLDAIMPKSKM